MKKQIQHSFLLILIATLFTGCELVEGIFEVGMGVGIFIVLAIIALVVFVVSRFRK